MFFSLLRANLKMMMRNRQALFWALVFPLIFVVVFGLFRMDEVGETVIVVVDKSQDQVSQELIANLGSLEILELDLDLDEERARNALKEGETDFVLIIPEGLAEKLQGPSQVTPVRLT